LSMLLLLHLQYSSQFGNCNQSLDWLEGKVLQTKSKFKKDQKNHEAELALKWKKEEEEEQEEANKNWKMVAESSALLTTTLGNTLTALVAGGSNNDNIDGKLSDFKKDL
jgi:flagellar biosynthesis component FlhA